MNWGWKIAIVYSTFAIMVLGIVFFTSMKRVSLVERDYYEKEIQYQDQIERIKNTNELGGDFRITFDEDSKMVAIVSKSQNISGGNVYFYRPSDSDKDVNVVLDIDANGMQFIDVKSLEKGLWVAKVDWTAEGRSFYKSIQIEI